WLLCVSAGLAIRWGRTTQAEAEVVGAIVRIQAVAAGGATAPRHVAPRSAAQHAPSRGVGPYGGTRSRSLRGILLPLLPPLPDPFPHISRGVVQAKRVLPVLPEAAHGRGAIPASAIRLALVELLAPPIGRRRARTGGILPLDLSREPVGLAGPLPQPLRVFLRVVPTHIDHRPTEASPVRILGVVDVLAVAPLMKHVGVVLEERHFVLPHGEGPGNRALAGRRLFARALAVEVVATRHAAHDETALRDLDHLWLGRVAQHPQRLQERIAEREVVLRGPPD